VTTLVATAVVLAALVIGALLGFLVAQLRSAHNIAGLRIELEAARAGTPAAVPPAEAATRWPMIAALSAAVGLAGGFWLGYATLARRVREKFGGLKVY